MLIRFIILNEDDIHKYSIILYVVIGFTNKFLQKNVYRLVVVAVVVSLIMWVKLLVLDHLSQMNFFYQM